MADDILCNRKMAEEAEQVQPEASSETSDAQVVEEKKAGNSKLLFILIPIILIVGLAGGYLLAPLFKGGKVEDKGKTEHSQKEEKAAESSKSAEEAKHITFINIPDVLVNLKTNGKRPVFLKIALVLELHDPTKKDGIENLKPKMIDQMQIFLRDLDVADVTGANNLQKLRQELTVRINNTISPLKVDDVLIKEFLVQ